MSKISTRRKIAREAGAADYARKRQEIIQAAAAVFRDQGLGNATMDEVAKRAGLDRASLYYYFNGKRELFREMVSAATNDNVEMAEAIAASQGDAETKLRQLIVGLFRSYERHYPYLYVYLQEDMDRLPRDGSAWSRRILDLNQRFDSAVTGIVSEGLGSGVFASNGSPKLIAAGVLGMCNWSHRWFRIDGPRSAEEIALIFSDMLLRGLVSSPQR